MIAFKLKLKTKMESYNIFIELTARRCEVFYNVVFHLFFANIISIGSIVLIDGNYPIKFNGVKIRKCDFDYEKKIA